MLLLELNMKYLYFQGDSGGPLTFEGVQVGLTSFGSDIGCEAGLDTLFLYVIYLLFVNALLYDRRA